MKKIHHKLAPSEITGGSLFLTEGDGMKDFFSQFSDSFDLVTKWETLYSRTVGKQYIWMGFTIMKHFNPFDIISIFEKDGLVYIEKNDV